MAITEYFVDSVSGGDVSPYATAANAAVDLRDVLNQADDPVVAGDVIYVLDTHNDKIAGTYTMTFPTGDKNKPVKVLCVSSLTTKAPSTGAQIGASNTWSDIVSNLYDTSFIMDGIHLYAGDDMFLGGYGQQSSWTYCLFRFNGTSAGSLIIMYGVDATYNFVNCEYYFTNAAQGFSLPVMGPTRFIGGGLHASSTAINDFIIQTSSSTRHSIIDIMGMDLSGGSGTFEIIKEIIDEEAGGEGTTINISGCSLPSGGAVTTVTPSNYATVVSGRGNSPVDEDVISDTLFKIHAGSVTDETSIVLDATSDGTTKYSYNFTTNTDSQLSPATAQLGLRYLLAEFWADAGSTLKVHAHHGGVTELLDTQIGIDVEYPDVTNPQLTRTYSTHNFSHGTGGALTTEADPGWANDLSNPNYYVFTADLSATSPTSGAGVHRVYGVLTADEAAITAYFDPAVDIT